MNSVTVTTAPFTSRLKAKIHADIAVMEFIGDSSFQEKNDNNNVHIKFGVISYPFMPPSSHYIIQREILKSFKSVVGALQDYLDELIALIKLSKEPLYPKVKNQEELNIFLDEKYREMLMKVSTNRSLTVPKKLQFLLPDEEDKAVKDSLQSLFDIRNGIEHHKGIAKTDRTLHFKKLTVVTSTSNVELKELGVTNENEGISLKTVDVVIKFDKGNQLLLDKNQLYSIISSLLITSIARIEISASKLIGQNSTSTNT